MESAIGILPPLDPPTTAFLKQVVPSASCSFYLVPSLACLNSKLVEKYSKRSPPYLFQIIEDFIIDFSTQDKSLLTGFKANYAHSFQIIEAIKFGEDLITGIKFRGPSLPKNVVLLSRESPELLRFIGQIRGMPLMEVGFSKARFEPVRRIGEGGNAKVYESFDTQVKQKVAVRCFKKKKVFQNGQYKSSFISEVQVMKKLNGQGFPQLKGVYATDQSIYMVMELFTRNLSAHIRRYGFPHFPQCKRLMFRLAQALNSLHQQNIMHRDIKPDNIMVRSDDPNTTEPIIVDFGMAMIGDAPPNSPIQGTPGYIAPEIFLKHGYGKRCDIFSMGVLFHFILLGEMVFMGNNENEVILLNRSGEIDYLFTRHPMIPAEMRSLLSGMLQKDPERRLFAHEVVEHPFFVDSA